MEKKFKPKSMVISAMLIVLFGCSKDVATTPEPPKVVIPPVVTVSEEPAKITKTTYYVDASIAASGNGITEATAFKTLAEAANVTTAGDGVLVKNGTYSNFTETTSGTASAWIVWRSFPGHRPLVSFNSWQGIYIKGSYVEIDGFDVKGNNSNITLATAQNQPSGCNNLMGSAESAYNGNGIYVDGRQTASNNPNGDKYHHINIRNCKVYDCGGGGIAAIQSDYIRIENCIVYNNAWYSIYGNSGISLYQNYNADNNLTDNRNIIRNNRIFNNKMLIPWRYGNCKFTDGNGIIIDDFKNTQNGSTLGEYYGKTLIENNVVYENGGRGIHVFIADNVTIVNNTTYQNCSTPEIDEGEITVIGKSSTVKNKNCSVYNNIMYARVGEKVNTISNNENFIQKNNIYFNSNLGSDLGTLGKSADPLFTNPTGSDFTILKTSPVIDFGDKSGYFPAKDFLNIVRFKGVSVDCGAYEIN